MAKKYTTVAKVEDYMLIEIDPAYEVTVNEYIEVITLLMDQMAGRSLVADSTATDRYFDGNDSDKYFIDEAFDITSVEIGDEYGADFEATTEYVAHPISPNPSRNLLLKSGEFTKGVQNIKVNAKWGLFETLPVDIAFACTVLVAGVLNSNMPSDQVVKSESIGNYSVTYTDQKQADDYETAMKIINSYKKLSL